MCSDKKSEKVKECTPAIECESPAVHSYLDLLQSVINRMASNSASCKSWCITLVSAIVVILIDKDKAQLALFAIAPTVIFALLDCYYLAMEKGFRDKYNGFVKKLHDGAVEKIDLFIISPDTAFKRFQMRKSAMSISIYPFYLGLIAMIIVIAFVASEVAASWFSNFIKYVRGG